MPQLKIPDDTYARLAARAEVLGTTVEALALPALEEVAKGTTPNGRPPAPTGDLPHGEWKRRYDEWQAAVRARADRYPPGYEADVSRESMYEGCGE